MPKTRRQSETLLDGWTCYKAEVIPAEAPLVQREESRRAFYAGAFLMFNLVMAAVAPESTDDCAARLEALQAEAEGITKDLRMD